MSIAFNPRPRRPRFSPVACSPVLGALGAVDLAPSWFAEEDALEVCIARTARHRRAVSALLRWLTYAAAAVTAAVLLFVVGYILVRGVPALTPDLFQWEYTSENVSLLPALASTVIMVLPVIMRTTEEALMAVPDSYREGGFGLGAGRLRTVARCVLPSAVPGILGGVILALGRCVGEVAALLFTAGTVAQIPDFAGQGIFALFDSCRTLAVHMYTLACEGLHVNEAYATSVVLLVLVLLLNAAMRLVATKMEVSKK